MSVPLILTALFVFAAPLFAEISPEAGAFYFQDYLPKVYSASPQNWAVAQDHRGVMYFGNTEGVLEYDGARWRRIPLPNLSTVRSLAVDDNGTVYVGGQGEIGFLQSDEKGALHYVSLLDRLGLEDRHFGSVWNVISTNSGIWFSSYQRIFRWSPDHRMKVWKPSSTFGEVFLVGNVLYLEVPDSGLYSIVGDTLQPIPGGEIFANTLVRGVFQFAGALVVAVPDRLYRYDGQKFSRLTTGADGLLRETQIYPNACKVLKDGTLAIGTTSGGLILLSPNGNLERVINTESGLDSNSVNGVYQDREGGLWLALSRGIARLDIGVPLTHFGDHEGLGEMVLVAQRQSKTLYAGTAVGLSRLAPGQGAAPKFVPVPGIHGQVNALLETPRGLLAGGQPGLYEVVGNAAWPVSSKVGAIYDLARSIRNPDVVYAAGRQGLFLLRQEAGYWKESLAVSTDDQDFRWVAEDSDGRVWVTTRTDIRRFDLTSNPAAIERFTKDQGVPPGWKWAFRVQGNIFFGTTKGLLRFDSRQKRFVPDNRFGKMFADASHSVSLFEESPTGDIWISGAGYHGVLHRNPSGGYSWEENPLVRSGLKDINAYFDPDGVVWVSGLEPGLVRYQPTAVGKSAPDLNILLRRVQILSTDQEVFGGNGSLSESLKFRHQQNGLRFDFAVPSFDDESRTEYQTFLQGLDKKWSNWSSTPSKEYTNLFEGRYVFRVRARDLYGRISREDTFGFRVLPPWYRTFWAYSLYALLISGAIWLLINWRLRAMAQQNRKLEGIIEERTAEIREQRDAIQAEEEKTQALLLNILPARVADELRTTGEVTPLTYDDITVCFTDFVGFTLASEKLPASELVAALHRYFTAFDEIIGRYGLEKLKTIGDSYMFVSGLPERRKSHAVDAVMASLEMVDAVERLAESGPGWSIRIGLHSGPVVAGVVGLRKFAFDIWGETVNFASRFESSGWPNRVNMSATTFELVREFIDCIPRGPVRIKEGRELEMYFARYIRKELLEDSSNGIPPKFRELYRKKFGSAPPSFPSIIGETTSDVTASFLSKSLS